MADVLTTEEQDAIIGRIVREKKAAQKRLAFLNEESDRIADAIGHLAAYLKNKPKHVWLEGLSTNGNHPDPHGTTLTTRDLDAARIARITSEIRDVLDTIHDLSEKERSLGL